MLDPDLPPEDDDDEDVLLQRGSLLRDLPAELPLRRASSERRRARRAARELLPSPDDLPAPAAAAEEEPMFLPTMRSPLQRVDVYASKRWVHVVGQADAAASRARVLTFDRSAADLRLTEDPEEYSQAGLARRLAVMRASDKDLDCVVRGAFGIVGAVRFLEGHYLLLISDARRVGRLGASYVYEVRRTQLVQLQRKQPNSTDEGRYRALFSSFDMSRDFFFSYSYDLTNTLSHNMTVVREADVVASGCSDAHSSSVFLPAAGMFCWNSFLLQPLLRALRRESHTDWVLPVTHGFFQQRALGLLDGRQLRLTLLARRSRHFAGTRYMRRGTNDKGNVANEVETEQIVSVDVPPARGLAGGGVSAVTQVRGSIPLFFSHPSARISPKPDIAIHAHDPSYEATRRHFARLAEQHDGGGEFLAVLNLVRQRESKPKESKLSAAFRDALQHINAGRGPDPDFPALRPPLHYVEFDFLGSPKARTMGALLDIAESVFAQTGIFVAAAPPGGRGALAGRRQRGVLRTNCIDCLDRTNVAQFCYGRTALAAQLEALLGRALDEQTYPRVWRALLDMYGDHGDHIAMQYGGSAAMHRATAVGGGGDDGGPQLALSGATRKVATAVHRYYSNNFSDFERQQSMNLFLGVYRCDRDRRTPLWDIDAYAQLARSAEDETDVPHEFMLLREVHLGPAAPPREVFPPHSLARFDDERKLAFEAPDVDGLALPPSVTFLGAAGGGGGGSGGVGGVGGVGEEERLGGRLPIEDEDPEARRFYEGYLAQFRPAAAAAAAAAPASPARSPRPRRRPAPSPSSPDVSSPDVALAPAPAPPHGTFSKLRRFMHSSHHPAPVRSPSVSDDEGVVGLQEGAGGAEGAGEEKLADGADMQQQLLSAMGELAAAMRVAGAQMTGQ